MQAAYAAEDQDQDDGIPEGIRGWLASQGLTPEEDVVTVALKKLDQPSKGFIGKFSSEDLDEVDFENVGHTYGPGKYQWLVNSAKGTKTKTMTLSNARYARPGSGGSATPAAPAQQMDVGSLVREQMSGTLEMLKALKPDPVPPAAPVTVTDNGNTNAMLAMMQEGNKATMMMMMGMMQTMGTVMAAAMQRPEPTREEPMKMIETVMGMARSIADLRAPAEAPERESIAERLVGMVTATLPDVLKVVTMRAEERQSDLKYRLVQAMPDVKAANSDPETQMLTAQKLAQKIGLTKTRDIAEALGWDSVVTELDNAIAERQESNEGEPAAEQVAP